MRKLKVVLLVLLALFLAVFYWGFHEIGSQGVPEGFWKTYSTAKVTFDADGIPTIAGPDWKAVTQAQGYVEASERLWQMDLIRRQSSGRLSQWFGEVAFEHDKRVRLEGRIEAATKAAESLPKEESIFCEAYSRGVNAFIREQMGRWGIEYRLLGVEPEPWSCRDSLLVILVMAEELTSWSDRESKMSLWARHLPEPWRDFLFPQEHPWNRPLFGKGGAGPVVPKGQVALPKRPIDSEDTAAVPRDPPDPIGSNNWAYRGTEGHWLANDPHLGHGVPGVWYMQRLKVSKDEWAVGVSIPGLPGIVLGMTPHFAWAFTNTGEDVDDLLEEKLDESKSRYMVRDPDGQERWEPLEKRTYEIMVKGEDEPRKVDGYFTRRGPLVQRPWMKDRWFSRQWLPLKDGMLRIPSLQMMQAKTLDEFDHAIDGMTVPPQNILSMDRSGRMRYRTSGIGVRRKVSGRWIVPADEGEWLGLETPAERRRLEIAPDVGPSSYLATANQRIWVDEFDHFWFSDDREERILRFLSAGENLDQSDMSRLHLDTQSRFRRLLLEWIAKNASQEDSSGPAQDLLAGWKGWDGSSESNEAAFTNAGDAEAALSNLLVGRVRRQFLPEELWDVDYVGALERAWLTVVLTEPGSLAAFGLESGEVADYLVKRVLAAKGPLHSERNRWRAQHPFVGRVPLIGRLFKIKEPKQTGASDVVKAERPKFGPSVRLVWNLAEPAKSTWIIPVGQSGHLASPWYRNFQDRWHRGMTVPVFHDPAAWGLGKTGE